MLLPLRHLWIIEIFSRKHLVLVLHWLVIGLPSLVVLLEIVPPLQWHTNFRLLWVGGCAKCIGQSVCVLRECLRVWLARLLALLIDDRSLPV